MKHVTIFVMVLVVGAILLLGGCGSRYMIVTSDYAAYISNGKPEMSDHGTDITFEDESGKEITIQRNNLRELRRLD